MRTRVKTELQDWQLYITDNPNNYYVQKFVENVSQEQHQSSKLIDNPYTYDRLIRFGRKFNILWLYKDEPVYGFFAVQYEKLPSNVIRMYTRMYKLKRKENKFSREFLYNENKTYSKYLKRLFHAHKIDTIFFTRHSATTLNDINKWKNPKRTKQFMNLDIKYVDNVKFRGVDQTIYYYNAWQPEIPLDGSFIKTLGNI
jgi:hypothetical protein